MRVHEVTHTSIRFCQSGLLRPSCSPSGQVLKPDMKRKLGGVQATLSDPSELLMPGEATGTETNRGNSKFMSFIS